MEENGWRRDGVETHRLRQLVGYPPKLPHKLGPKLNGYIKAQDDSQMEPSRALLFSPVKLQNAICLLLYTSILSPTTNAPRRNTPVIPTWTRPAVT